MPQPEIMNRFLLAGLLPPISASASIIAAVYFFAIFSAAWRLSSRFRYGTIIAAEIANAPRSAKGITRAMPEIPNVLLSRSIKTISRLPLRRSGQSSGCTFFADRLKGGDAHKFERRLRAGKADNSQEPLPVADRFGTGNEAARNGSGEEIKQYRSASRYDQTVKPASLAF